MDADLQGSVHNDTFLDIALWILFAIFCCYFILPLLTPFYLFIYPPAYILFGECAQTMSCEPEEPMRIQPLVEPQKIIIACEPTFSTALLLPAVPLFVTPGDTL